MTPKTTAIANPISVVTKVWLAFSQMPDQYSMRASTAWLGAGRMNGGVFKKRGGGFPNKERPNFLNHGRASKKPFFPIFAPPPPAPNASAKQVKKPPKQG